MTHVQERIAEATLIAWLVIPWVLGLIIGEYVAISASWCLDSMRHARSSNVGPHLALSKEALAVKRAGQISR